MYDGQNAYTHSSDLIIALTVIDEHYSFAIKTYKSAIINKLILHERLTFKSKDNMSFQLFFLQLKCSNKAMKTHTKKLKKCRKYFWKILQESE